VRRELEVHPRVGAVRAHRELEREREHEHEHEQVRELERRGRTSPSPRLSDLNWKLARKWSFLTCTETESEWTIRTAIACSESNTVVGTMHFDTARCGVCTTAARTASDAVTSSPREARQADTPEESCSTARRRPFLIGDRNLAHRKRSKLVRRLRHVRDRRRDRPENRVSVGPGSVTLEKDCRRHRSIGVDE
jgi:hypothetical protein